MYKHVHAQVCVRIAVYMLPKPPCHSSRSYWEASQRLPSPLIKKYALNLIRVPSIMVYSLIDGFWSLWVCSRAWGLGEWGRLILDSQTPACKVPRVQSCGFTF